MTPSSLRGSKIVLTGTSFQHLAFAAKELEKVNVPEEATVTGPIIALRSEEPPLDVGQDTFEHMITMLWEIERGTFIRLRVPLSATEYRQACDAHKEGRPVSIRGKPEKRGKFWTLALARDFRVLIR